MPNNENEAVSSPMSPQITALSQRITNPQLDRFLTVNPADSPLRYEADIAIIEGRVLPGENRAEKRREEFRKREETLEQLGLI
jgi:hypothetical protein